MEVNKTRYWQMYIYLILIFESDLVHANISYGLTCECKYVYLMIFVGMRFLGCFGVGGIGLLSATMQLRNLLCRRSGGRARLPTCIGLLSECRLVATDCKFCVHVAIS